MPYSIYILYPQEQKLIEIPQHFWQHSLSPKFETR